MMSVAPLCSCIQPASAHARMYLWPQCGIAQAFRGAIDPEVVYGFHGWAFNLYRDAEPHEGYQILRRWTQHLGTLGGRDLRRGVHSHSEQGPAPAAPKPDGGSGAEEKAELHSSWFVLTSNVDRHFHRAGFDPRLVKENHGCMELWQCTRGAACNSRVWGVPAAFRFVLEEHADGCMRAPANGGPLSGFGRNHPICADCGGPARPNTLLFSDDAHVYSDNERAVSDGFARWRHCIGRRCKQGAQLVILEIGCGVTVEAMRSEIDCFMGEIYPSPASPPAADGAARAPCWPAAASDSLLNPAAPPGRAAGWVWRRRAVVVRINPSSELLPFERAPPRSPDHFIHVACGALQGLRLIDGHLRAADQRAGEPPGGK